MGVENAPAKWHMPQQNSFLHELSYDQLQKLRMVIKRVHMAYYPKDFVTDAEADKILESEGREWAEMAMKVLIDRKLADR